MVRTRTIRPTAFVATIVVLILVLSLPAGAQAPMTASIPDVEGPITGPGTMFPGLQPVPTGTDLKDYDYVVNEYFVSGTASGQPYTTRILVRKPKDPNRFSGIVVSEAMHSSGNNWMFYFTRIYVMSQGHAHVEIAPQKNATEGQIVASNPERYSRISIPDSDQANEIIAQVGALIKSNLDDGPFQGMEVRRLTLMGTSQSAGTLRGYLSAHPIYRLPGGAPIFDGFLPTSHGGNSPIPAVDVPLIQLPTQTEVQSGAANGLPYRRPDGNEPGDQFRLYEIAGMPHNDSRESPSYAGDFCSMPLTDYPVGAMMAMALDNLVDWVDEGTPPPRAQRIMVDGDEANDGSLLKLDAHGNARGGIRSTYLDVPIATYGVPNTGENQPGNRSGFLCTIAGYELPLSDDVLHSLYSNKADYESKVSRRLDALISGGWFLSVYSDQVLGDAAKADIP